MMENIVKIFLLLGSPSLLGIFICIGFIWKRSFFFPLSLLLLVSCCVNIALKVTFQAPLAPHIGSQWFAFPSGHMQSATMVYGFLACHIKKPTLLTGLSLILLGIGTSLIISGFHNIADVIGGFFVATSLLWIYRSQRDRMVFHKWMWAPITILPLYSLWMLWDTPHAWEKAGFWATVSWMGVFFLNQKLHNKFSLKTTGKTIATIVFFFLIATLHLLNEKIHPALWKHISVVGVCFLTFSIWAGASLQISKGHR